jgi:hypothetical protein
VCVCPHAKLARADGDEGNAISVDSSDGEASGGSRVQSLIVHPTDSATVTLTIDAAHGQAADVAAVKGVRRAMGTLFPRLMVNVKQLCQRDKGHWMLLASQHDAVLMYAHADDAGGVRVGPLMQADGSTVRQLLRVAAGTPDAAGGGSAAARSNAAVTITVAVEACVMLLAAIVCVRSKCDVDVRVSIQAGVRSRRLWHGFVEAMVAAVCPTRKHMRAVVQALTADAGAWSFAVVY